MAFNCILIPLTHQVLNHMNNISPNGRPSFKVIMMSLMLFKGILKLNMKPDHGLENKKDCKK